MFPEYNDQLDLKIEVWDVLQKPLIFFLNLYKKNNLKLQLKENQDWIKYFKEKNIQ
jgi:hypothetical protein